jgi:hypothetical protein
MRQLEQSDGQDALRQNRADLGIAEESRFQGLGIIPKLGNLDSWCPTLCGDDRIVNASRIKCLDGRDKPAATPHMGREQRELV